MRVENQNQNLASQSGCRLFLLSCIAKNLIVLCLDSAGCFFPGGLPIIPASLFLFGSRSAEPLAWTGVYDPHDSKMDGLNSGGLEQTSSRLKTLNGASTRRT